MMLHCLLRAIIHSGALEEFFIKQKAVEKSHGTKNRPAYQSYSLEAKSHMCVKIQQYAVALCASQQMVLALFQPDWLP